MISLDVAHMPDIASVAEFDRDAIVDANYDAASISCWEAQLERQLAMIGNERCR